MAPGATHHARWMSKALYSLKIWMFRGQFKLTIKEEKGLRNICIFIVRIYFKAWFTAPNPIVSSNHDLHFLQLLDQYETVNKSIANATRKKFADHLWYLSEELVGFAFLMQQYLLNPNEQWLRQLMRRKA